MSCGVWVVPVHMHQAFCQDVHCDFERHSTRWKLWLTAPVCIPILYSCAAACICKSCRGPASLASQLATAVLPALCSSPM